MTKKWLAIALLGASVMSVNVSQALNKGKHESECSYQQRVASKTAVDNYNQWSEWFKNSVSEIDDAQTDGKITEKERVDMRNRQWYYLMVKYRSALYRISGILCIGDSFLSSVPSPDGPAPAREKPIWVPDGKGGGEYL